MAIEMIPYLANCEMKHFIQVVSDKKLLKHLQKQVARLEAELRSPDPKSSPSIKSLLVEKDLKIQQV